MSDTVLVIQDDPILVTVTETEQAIVTEDINSSVIINETDTLLVTQDAGSIVTVTETETVVVVEGGSNPPVFIGAGANGLVPDPVAETGKYLKDDGTWGTPAGGGGGAPVDAQYVVLSADVTLTVERVLTAGTGLDIIDAGAGSTVTVALSDMEAATLKGRASGGGTGAPGDLTATQVRTIINVEDGANNYSHPNHSGDVVSVGDGATTIQAGVVSNSKLANMDQALIKGRASVAGTGDPQDLTATQVRTIINVEDGANDYSHPNHSGDVTSVGDGATSITNKAVTNTKLADIDADRIKGRANGVGTGEVTDLTPTQVRTIINVEDGATADQTGAEIKVLYEGELDTNAFTDAEKTKLTGIEAGATADQVASEVPFTSVGDLAATDVQAALAELDSEKSATGHVHAVFIQDTDGFVPGPSAAEIAAGGFLKVDGSWNVPAGSGDVVGPGSALNNAVCRFDGTTGKLIQSSLVGVDDSGNIILGALKTVDGRDVSVDGSKLDGIEAGATADQTAAEVDYTPSGDLIATDVQAALDELESEKSATGHVHAVFIQDTDGFVPGPTVADITGNKILRADGAWIAQSGGGAPVDVSYVVLATDVTLTAERVLTGGTAITITDGGAGSTVTISVTDGTINTTQLANGAVDNTKLADMAQDRIKGRVSVGAGDPEDLTATQVRTMINVEDGANAYTHPNHSGDVTSVGDGATTIAVGAVTNAKLASMAEATIKGRASGAGLGEATNLTATQVRTIINVEDGATADQTGAEIKSLYEAELDTNAFTDAEKTKLTGIEAGATADQVASEVGFTPSGDLIATNVQAAIEELDTEKATAGHVHAVFIQDTDGFAPGPTVGEIAAGSFLKADGTWSLPSGAGDVVGPSSATDNAVCRFNLATGKLIQDSLVTVDDSGNIAVPALATIDGRDVSVDGSKLDGIEAGAKAGDVVGPAIVVDNGLCRFDGTSGKLIQGSAGIWVDDFGNLDGFGQVYGRWMTTDGAKIDLIEAAWATLTYAASITPDADNGRRFELTLTGDCTINVPTHIAEGMIIIYRIRQDATGGRLVTWHANYRTGQIPDVQVALTAAKTTYVVCVYHEGDVKMDMVSFMKDY